MSAIIRFAILCLIMWFIMSLLGYIVASVLLLTILFSNKLRAYYKQHKRFSDWEFSQYQRSNYITINGNVVTQKVKKLKRLDRRLGVWETKNVVESINQIYYTGKVNKNTKLDDIFRLYHKL